MYLAISHKGGAMTDDTRLPLPAVTRLRAADAEPSTPRTPDRGPWSPGGMLVAGNVKGPPAAALSAVVRDYNTAILPALAGAGATLPPIELPRKARQNSKMVQFKPPVKRHTDPMLASHALEDIDFEDLLMSFAQQAVEASTAEANEDEPQPTRNAAVMLPTLNLHMDESKPRTTVLPSKLRTPKIPMPLANRLATNKHNNSDVQHAKPKQSEGGQANGYFVRTVRLPTSALGASKSRKKGQTCVVGEYDVHVPRSGHRNSARQVTSPTQRPWPHVLSARTTAVQSDGALQQSVEEQTRALIKHIVPTRSLDTYLQHQARVLHPDADGPAARISLHIDPQFAIKMRHFVPATSGKLPHLVKTFNYPRDTSGRASGRPSRQVRHRRSKPTLSATSGTSQPPNPPPSSAVSRHEAGEGPRSRTRHNSESSTGSRARHYSESSAIGSRAAANPREDIHPTRASSTEKLTEINRPMGMRSVALWQTQKTVRFPPEGLRESHSNWPSGRVQPHTWQN